MSLYNFTIACMPLYNLIDSSCSNKTLLYIFSSAWHRSSSAKGKASWRNIGRNQGQGLLPVSEHTKTRTQSLHFTTQSNQISLEERCHLNSGYIKAMQQCYWTRRTIYHQKCCALLQPPTYIYYIPLPRNPTSRVE